MVLTRREFGKGSVLLAAAGSLGGSSMLEGCTGSEVINEINVVLKEAAAVLAVAEPGASWLEPLQNAIGALMAAEQQWQTGSTVQLVIDALNTIVAITAVIPLTEVYSPLIDVLVAGIEAVLAALPQSSNRAGVKATSLGNPHVGRTVIKRHWYHTPATDFKDAWNSVARSIPSLSGAVLV
jgi:hypothetical protein